MWLILPTSASSPESEDSILPCDSLFHRLVASAMWRSKHLRPESWRRVWRTVPWARRLSGLTLEPSLQDSIVVEWLEQFSVSPVRISLSQESKRASKVKPGQDSSTTPCESFARLDASGCFWKTSLQFSLFQQDTPYSESLPKAGSMRSGFLFARPKWERPTAESGYSSLDIEEEDGENWPTARSSDGEKGGPNQRGGGRGDLMLSSAAAQWKTPHGMGGLDASGKNGGSGGGEFAKQATQWTTPQAHDSGGGNPSRVRRKGTQHGCSNLADDVTKWTHE